MAKTEKNFVKVVKEDGSMGFFMFTSFMGALVYFVQQSEGFGGFVLAIIKAIVWPALIVHEVLTRLALS